MKFFIRVTFLVLILALLFSGVTFCATGFSGGTLDVSYCLGNQFTPLAIIDEITNDPTDDNAEFKKEKSDLLYFCFSPKEVLEFLLTSSYFTFTSSIPVAIRTTKNIPLARDSLVP